MCDETYILELKLFGVFCFSLEKFFVHIKIMASSIIADYVPFTKKMNPNAKMILQCEKIRKDTTEESFVLEKEGNSRNRQAHKIRL